MKVKKLGALLLALMMLMVFVVGCGGQNADQTGSDSAEAFKVGFMYIGHPGDAGWTYAHDQGRKYLEEQIPNVETKVIEDVKEGSADVQRFLEQLAQEGCKVIVANSFGFGPDMLEVAKKYPDIKFLHCSGLETSENVATFFGRIYQPRYLSGMIAGAMTESNKIGYVAAHPFPEVKRGINAFTLGAQAVNPDVTVQVVWTNTWFDPTKEKLAAETLLQEGCDVIAQHQDTPSAQEAAAEAGKYCVGYNSDMSKFAPDAHLTAPVWNWGPYYVKAVKAAMDGSWQSDQYWGGLEDGIVDLAPVSDKVPAEVLEQVEAKKKAMKNGEWDVFTGPISDQDGNLKVEEGQKMSDNDMLNMDWLVKGVVDNTME